MAFRRLGGLGGCQGGRWRARFVRMNVYSRLSTRRARAKAGQGKEKGNSRKAKPKAKAEETKPFSEEEQKALWAQVETQNNKVSDWADDDDDEEFDPEDFGLGQ